MSGDARPEPGPPWLLRVLAGLLIRGGDAPFIIRDLDASFARDVSRGLGRWRAGRRYAWNVLGSIRSVWTAGLRRLLTQGIGLDAKLGVRMLFKQPLITAVTVLTLGIGIPGSLTFVHGVDVLYGELPVPDGHRVVGLRHYDVDGRRAPSSSPHDYERWMGLTSLESIGAVRAYTVNVDAGEVGPSPVRAARITASSFDVLRARPLLGRVLDAADERERAPNVALLSEDLWSARFARDPEVVGRSVRVNGALHTIVGVMPADFRFPASTQLWLPFPAGTGGVSGDGGPGGLVFGRLADGVSPEDAEVEMVGLTARRAADDPEHFAHLVGEVVDMPILLFGERDDGVVEGEGVVIQALIFALLLVVCGNVGTLILARTAARSAEITIRTALGASRARILTQLFVEALVLVMVATGLGLAGANALAGWVMRLQAPYDVLPYWADLTLTPRIVAIALGLAAVCAVVAGVVPALSATRGTIQADLQSAASRSTSLRFGIGSSLLIVSQIVLSVGFLAMGAARVRSMVAHQGTNLGFDPERYVVATLTVPEPLGDLTAADSVVWARRVEETQRLLLTRLGDDPGVVGVALGVDLPGLSRRNRDVILEAPPTGFEPVGWDALIPHVGASFFEGLNRPILAGRDFNAGDVEGAPDARPEVVIVNESFVRDYLGGRSAVGRRLRHDRGGPGVDDPGDGWYEIVGVVGSFGANPQNSARDAAVYHPIAPGEVNPIRYAVEVAGDPESFVPRLRQVAASVDREATVDVNLLGAQMRTTSTATRALYLIVLGIASATFLLAATGLYALISFTVSRRTRELGIRAALGAGTTDIVAAVARRAVGEVGVGLTLGVACGWMLLNNQRNLIEVEVGNIPLTLALTAAVAGTVCVLACAYPTRRAIRIQPTEALRES